MTTDRKDDKGERKKSAGFCMYCGNVFHAKDTSNAEVARVYAETIEHDQKCTSNPLVKRIRELEAIATSSSRATDQFTAAHNALNRVDTLLIEAGFTQDSSIRHGLKIAKSMFREAEQLPASRPIQAHSKTEFKRLKEQGADVLPPAKNPRGFSDFIRNASPEEKAKVYGEVMERATEKQLSAERAADQTASTYAKMLRLMAKSVRFVHSDRTVFTSLADWLDCLTTSSVDDIDRSYALSLADAVENCRVTCKHEPSAFDLEQQGYNAIIRALRAYARHASARGPNGG